MRPPTISKSILNLSTINDNMALKRIVDCALLGIYREKPLDSTTYYPINIEVFKELSAYTDDKSPYRVINDLALNIEEEINQTISEAFKTILRFENDTRKGIYHPITSLAKNKLTGELEVRFSQELIDLVQGKEKRQIVDNQGDKVIIKKFKGGEYYQQDSRMLSYPASIHAMYDLIAKNLYKGQFTLDLVEIREKLELDYIWNGKEVHKYRMFSEFDRNILAKTIEAMGKIGIVVEYKAIRRAKGVVGVRFTKVAGEVVSE